MANLFFPRFKYDILNPSDNGSPWVVDWIADDICATIYDQDVDVLVPGDDYVFSDLNPSAIIATQQLTGKNIQISGTTIYMKADNVTFSNVTGATAEALVIWKVSGNSATSVLIAHFDTFDSGMPVTPNGGDIVLDFNTLGVFSW